MCSGIIFKNQRPFSLTNHMPPPAYPGPHLRQAHPAQVAGGQAGARVFLVTEDLPKSVYLMG